jgi:hypothetical protein
MGLRDKITGLRDQAQEAVAEHKDQIQGAMENAGAAVDRKTHGKYTDKIAKYGQKASDAVDKFGGEASDEPGTAAPGTGAPGTAAPETGAPGTGGHPDASTPGAPSGAKPDVGTTGI